MSSRKKRLAKDLDLLIGASQTPAAEAPASSSENTENTSRLRSLPIEKLCRGKYQPRREFDSQALEELADSIRREGVLQPIVVRPIDADQWEIIAGERRWRASQLAGADVIPALVHDVSDESAIAMALIENIQRENLNGIEEAQALKRLQDEFSLSQQQVADRVGKSRSVIANLLRLLSLETQVREMVASRHLDIGHGKVLLALEGPAQVKAAKQVLKGRLSVRQTEALVKSMTTAPTSEGANTVSQDPNIMALERDLSTQLGAAVAIQHGKTGRGKVVIDYASLDQLDGILRRFR